MGSKSQGVALEGLGMLPGHLLGGVAMEPAIFFPCTVSQILEGRNFIGLGVPRQLYMTRPFLLFICRMKERVQPGGGVKISELASKLDIEQSVNRKKCELGSGWERMINT